MLSSGHHLRDKKAPFLFRARVKLALDRSPVVVGVVMVSRHRLDAIWSSECSVGKFGEARHECIRLAEFRALLRHC